MTGSAARVGAVARRELRAYFHAPIAYVVMVLFLALEGFSFWAVVEVLSDPARPAGYGAVLRTHFGGTFLYWAVLFAVIALCTMRLVAEEKRTGTWEALLTTPVGAGEVALGKWLGALGFYLLLWLPTVVYPVVLAIYAPVGTHIDVGPIVSAYGAVMLSGAGFLALGLAASAATDNQVVAAVVSFAGLLGLLLVGQLADVAGDLGGGPLAALVHQLDLRAHMDAAARGAVGIDSLALWIGLGALGLAGAVVLIARGRGTRAAARRRLWALALVALDVVLANVLAVRHPAHWDVSADHANQLDDRTRAVLDTLDQPVTVTVVRPEVNAFDPVYDQVDRVLHQMSEAQPLITRETVNPTRDPARLGELAGQLALMPRYLADDGAVLFTMGDRRRGVDLLDLADFHKDALDVGAVARFRAEEAFARALVELSAPGRQVICATSGHGEMPLSEAGGGAADWSAVGERLRRDGFAIEDVGQLTSGVPDRCRVLVVAGPQAPLPSDAALAVSHYLDHGGRLLVAADDQPLAQAGGGATLPATGLELVLAGYGVSLPAAVVMDSARGGGRAADLGHGHRLRRAPHHRGLPAPAPHGVAAPARGRLFGRRGPQRHRAGARLVHLLGRDRSGRSVRRARGGGRL